MSEKFAVIDPAAADKLFWLASVEITPETMTVEFAPDFWTRPNVTESRRLVLATVDSAMQRIAEKGQS